MFCGEGFNVKRRQIVMGDATKVIEPRRRKPLHPPGMHGGGRRFRSLGDGCRAAQPVDQIICKGIHGPCLR